MPKSAEHLKERGFKPGQSGNPGGRPKVPAEFREAARGYSVEALKTLAEIIRNPRTPAAARVSAIGIMLDRAYGRPPQSAEVTINRALEELPDAELLAIINMDEKPPEQLQ